MNEGIPEIIDLCKTSYVSGDYERAMDICVFLRKKIGEEFIAKKMRLKEENAT